MKNKIIKLLLFILSVSFLLAFSSCGLLGGNEQEVSATAATLCPDCGTRNLADWVVTEEPTCAKRGARQRVCSNCGYTIDSYVEKLDHTFGEWTEDTPPTCTESGKEKRICTECDKTEYRTVYPTGEHTYDIIKVFNEATCKSGGEDEHICSGCGKSYLEKTPKVDHAYGEWSVKYVSYCTQEGKKERFCKWCNQKEEGAIPVDYDNHLLSDKIIEYIKQPTCQEEGEALKECYYCKQGFPVTVEKSQFHDYDYDNAKVLKAATCTENGRQEISCKDCGDSYEAAIIAPGHAYGEWKVTKEPTCAEGSHERVCDVCGVKQTEAMPAVTEEHTYGEWTLDKAATCGEDGRETKVCKFCNDEQENILPATGNHSYGKLITVDEPTCTEVGSGKMVCSVCSHEKTETIRATGHAYGRWTVAKEPTCVKKGEKQKTCVNCGDIVTDDVAPTGIHEFVGKWAEFDLLYHYRTCKNCIATEEERHSGDPCSACGFEFPDATSELEYELNSDGESYAVKGIKDNGSGYPSSVVIPSYYGGKPVTDIKSKAFNMSCKFLKSIVFPDTLEYIGSNNFGYAGIEHLVIPDGVETIGEQCFSSSSIRTLEIGAGLKNIFGSGPFYMARNLEKITVSKDNKVYRSKYDCLIKGNAVVRANKTGFIPTDGDITEIGSSAYTGCDTVKTIVIPDNIKVIGGSAFDGCMAVTSLKIHTGVTQVKCFFGSTVLAKAELPAKFIYCLSASVKEVVVNGGTTLDGTFKNFTSLRKVTLPDGIATFPDSLFEGCVSLDDVKIGSGLESVGASAFKGCSSLAAVTLPSSLKTIGSYAFGESGINKITLPNGLESIGESAFTSCNELVSVKIPDGVTKIEKSTFRYCGKLETVDCGKGVTEIGDYAFAHCVALTQVSLGSACTKIGDYAFAYDLKLAKINYGGTAAQWKSVQCGYQCIPSATKIVYGN